MKTNSFFCDAAGGQNRLQELAWRWSAALWGQRRDRTSHPARREIEFALDTGSVCRIGGNIRGLRIDCRQGRLWLTQAGVAADVILQPGQGFVCGGGGAIVLQPVSASNASDQMALGTLTEVPAEARMKILRADRTPVHTRVGIDLAAAGGTEGAFERCTGTGVHPPHYRSGGWVPPVQWASRTDDFAGETPVHRRLEARATIFRAPSEWLEQLVLIALWLCGFFSVGYCLKVVLSLF